jgi:hypothetical protein
MHDARSWKKGWRWFLAFNIHGGSIFTVDVSTLFGAGKQKRSCSHVRPSDIFNTEDSDFWALLIFFLSLGWFWGNGVIPYF